MLKALYKIDVDAVPSLHLFETLITPILNYNCEVLSQLSKHKIEVINNNKYRLEKLYFDSPGEKLHLQLITVRRADSCKMRLRMQSKRASGSLLS